MRDRQFLIELQKFEIGRRDVAHQGELDAAAAILTGEELGTRGLVEPADPSPEVDFPSCRKIAVKSVRRCTGALGVGFPENRIPAAVCPGRVAHGGKQLSVDLGRDRAGLLDTSRRYFRVRIHSRGPRGSDP